MRVYCICHKLNIYIFQDSSEAVTLINTFLKSTLIPICKELQSYMSNSLNYFNDIDLDYVLTEVLKIQPNAEALSTSVSFHTEATRNVENIYKYRFS